MPANSPIPFSLPLRPFPPPVLLDGKFIIRIPIQMVNSNKQSFSHCATGKFVGRRPSLEAVEQWVISLWRLSRPCMISLTEKGNFIFRSDSKEDKEELSSDILLSIAASIGKPLRLEKITAKQWMFSFARVQVLPNVVSSSPGTLTVKLEGEDIVEVEVQYESILCSQCLSARHLSTKCPFIMKPGLLKTHA
ncbi:hypothetical protein MRB53_026185 [Persea americana]|uniref:Uncharacterized protein n=1 Tax=Persea americana TaxID=3435 RepID=A0ACC2LIJ4_PERAE|nr:hypothetical protein MRB53_026185 [Persea americana]